MPRQKPGHYGLIPDGVTDYALWTNVDRIASDGVDIKANIFEYPWTWAEDNSFDGALLAHIVEHIPHGNDEVDGFYRFFGELHRVLRPGSTVHVLAPYAWSFGAMADPTHTRYVLPGTFSYLEADDNAPFVKEAAGKWKVLSTNIGLTGNGQEAVAHSMTQFQQVISSQINVASEFYVKLEVLDDDG